MLLSPATYHPAPVNDNTPDRQQDTSYPGATPDSQRNPGPPASGKAGKRSSGGPQGPMEHAVARRSAQPLVAADGDPAPRSRRQPPSLAEAYLATQKAYADSASASKPVDRVTLSRELTGTCVGMTMDAMSRVADQRAPDLLNAFEQMRTELAGPNSNGLTERIHQLQATNAYQPTTPVQGYTQREGGYERNAAGLIKDLDRQFGKRHTTNDGSGSEQYTFAQLGLGYPDRTGHAIVLQRLNPSDNHRNDAYQLYDPNVGVFRYPNFQALSTALTHLHSSGYQDRNGIAGVRSTYYSDSRTYQPYGPSNPRPGLWNSLLSRFRGNAQPTPPSVQLPPLPDFDQPGPSGRLTQVELKRSVDGENHDRQPFALYRPSTMSPDELKKQAGFSVTDTPLNDISLDMHDYDVQHGRGNVDGAGYLGTFRDKETANRSLADSNQTSSEQNRSKQSGYIYQVAPSPGMVDVNASLGTQARNPNDGEVAAMGTIPYTQIRGWQKVQDGKPGPYEANPDYRWDIYDRTKTAAAEPQLAGFSPENPAWGDDLHKPFASQVTRGDDTFYKPNEDPAMRNARFIQHADALVKEAGDAQSAGRDYRGPVHIKPKWSNDGGTGSTRLEFAYAGGNGYPSVDSSRGPDLDDELRFNDDGRISLARDSSKVLRIDSNGNAYIGAVPKDKSSLNGVVAYNPDSGALKHLEDDKWLTEGAIAFTPYVSAAAGSSGGLIERQLWNIEDTHGKSVQPPMPQQAYDIYLKHSTAGDPETLRDFETNPDSMLPRQATHFVTAVPGTTSNPDNRFLSYVNRILPGEGKAANDWLRSHNAAWLFRDGFSGVSIDANTLEVRTISGTPVWHVHIDPATGKETYENPQQTNLSSNYTVSDTNWNRVKQNEERDRELELQAQS